MVDMSYSGVIGVPIHATKMRSSLATKHSSQKYFLSHEKIAVNDSEKRELSNGRHQMEKKKYDSLESTHLSSSDTSANSNDQHTSSSGILTRDGMYIRFMNGCANGNLSKIDHSLFVISSRLTNVFSRLKIYPLGYRVKTFDF